MNYCSVSFSSGLKQHFALSLGLLSLGFLSLICGCDALTQAKTEQAGQAAKQANGIRVTRMVLLQPVTFASEGSYGFADGRWNVPLAECDNTLAAAGGVAQSECSVALENAVAKEWKLSQQKILMMHTLPVPVDSKLGKMVAILGYSCHLVDVFVEAHESLLKSAGKFSVEYFDLVLGSSAKGKEFIDGQSYQVSKQPLSDGTALLGLRFLLVTGCHYSERPNFFSKAQLALGFKIGNEVYSSPASGNENPLFPAALQQGFEWNLFQKQVRKPFN